MHVVDALARTFITLGGLGTILAVSLVCVFLAWVVVPLFLPPAMLLVDAHEARSESANPVHLQLDEYLTTAWAYFPDGVLRTYHVRDGSLLGENRLFEANRLPTASSFAVRRGYAAFGFDDGSVQMGTVRFTTRFVDPDTVPGKLHELSVGETAPFHGGILERTPERQFRLQRLEAIFEDPIPAEVASAILRVDQSIRESGPTVTTLSADGVLRISQVHRRKNILTGEVTQRLSGGETRIEIPSQSSFPRWLLLSGLGDNVYLAWEDGRLLRFDTRDRSLPKLAEEVDLVEEPGARLTALGFQIGKTSLVAGDSLGRVRAWFRIKPEDAGTIDGARLVMAHNLPALDSPVTALSASERTRMLAAGYESGDVRLFHVTSDRLLVSSTPSPGMGSVGALTFAPKDDALLATSRNGLSLWKVDAPHPETTLVSIFEPVWYEGYPRPEHVWQSSSGTDDFEPKYGLYPLVFGTIKATFYSMLFGLPIALLAAVYTSEFMHPRIKAVVKPSIELMASLPSVVLGFLAALVIAPAVEHVVPEMLISIVTIPLAFLLGAYLWQVLPVPMAVRLERYRLASMATTLPIGIALALLLGDPFERRLFAGDIKAWLAGQVGTGTGGWMLLLLPVSAVVVAFGVSRWGTPLLRRLASEWSPARLALVDLLKFVVAVGATLCVALTVSFVLSALGFDPRGSYVDTYVQRNALVVGFIMGFAVIPIIYTISEDALSAVPEHLRAASLGAGATPWQTAVRIIIPTAMSGLFSAMMIGLGRAVGETMIVLMAAGNTPVMDWNVFNGFRTLSANIAVELPEAVRNSTHYRMLFLAALCLFVMTFLVNTIAEAVRLRFRRRAYQL